MSFFTWKPGCSLTARISGTCAVALLLLLAALALPKNAYAADRASLGNQEATSKATEAKYKLKSDHILYEDEKGTVRGIVFIQYPQFAGSSAPIKKVNKKIRKISREFLQSENAEALKECVMASIAEGRFYGGEQYYWTASCDVSYNKNGIVSFNMLEQWYAGGVHNLFEYGLNYNLETGKKLSVNDVISGDAKKKILKAAKKYCGSDANAYEIIKNTKQYQFYLEKGNVFICFGSYELGRGNTTDKFSVKGKYK